MKNKTEVERFEKTAGQLSSLHDEFLVLTKKSPNDSVNKFKLKIVNQLIMSANAMLGPSYRPLDDFAGFDLDDVPTNSDVTVVLAQYISQAERFRSDNVVYENYKWIYRLKDKSVDVPASAPTRVGSKNVKG